MGLENADYISELIQTNPTPTDFINEGDDHLRLLKKVLQQSFPNVNAEVSTSTDDLNNGFIPVGGIIMWSGILTNLPGNWAICNGSNGTPNLQDRFIVASTGDAGGRPTGSQGGSHDAIVPLHDHGADGTLIAVLHNHGGVIKDTTHSGQGAKFEGSGTNYEAGATQNATADIQGRTNDFGEDPTEKNMPLYYALAFVQRIS